MSVALCVGCFDPLHAGHILHFLQARQYADMLAVAVTEDFYVNKPNRPKALLSERMKVISQLKCVDMVTHCKSSLEALQIVRPFCFVLGSEYVDKVLAQDRAWCAEHDIAICFTNQTVYSSTKILDDLTRRG